MRQYQKHMLQISEYFLLQANYVYQSMYSIEYNVYKVRRKPRFAICLF